MFSLPKLFRTALLLSFAATTSIHTKFTQKELGNAYLSSYGVVAEDNNKQELTPEEKKRVKVDLRSLSNQEKRHIVFNILSGIDTNNQEASTADQNLQRLLQDLAVIHGQQESEDVHLASILNHCMTTFGEAALVNMLAQNINNPEKLHARQALIKELTTNQNLRYEVEQLLFEVKNQIDPFLSSWQTNDEATKEFIDKLYFSNRFLKYFNTNPAVLESYVRLGNFGTVVQSIQIPANMILSSYLVQFIEHKFAPENRPVPAPTLKDAVIKVLKEYNPLTHINNIKNTDNQLERERLDELSWLSQFDSINTTKTKEEEINQKFSRKKRGARIGTTLFAAYIYGLGIYQGYLIKKACDDAILVKNATNFLHTRLIGAATFVHAVKSITQLASENACLADGLVLYDDLFTLLAPHKNSNFEYLINLLQTNTFKGEASFFSLSGRVLAANKLMEENKQEFASAMLALGELDACLAIAKLMRKFEDKRATYCFVDFVEQETPYVHLQDFWNPFVNPETVVTNSIEFGDSQPRAIIVTGSNTGGKSTNLKALMISVLLARTFGIAPARSAKMTYIDLLGTSMNVSDNTAKGDSLFQAEVKRAQNLVNTVASLGNKFGFLIIDELFTGTGVEKGTMAAKKVAEHLAKSNNIILVLATHFPELTALEQETNLFKNYKVDVYKDTDGNLVRPFKLEPGVSTSNIADDILHERLDFLNNPAQA